VSGHSVSALHDMVIEPMALGSASPNGHPQPAPEVITDNASDSGAAARAVLLATKLHVPAMGAQLVHRPALLDALSAGRRRKLTLVSAPAGWGKTTLLAQWARSAGEDQRVGWLSLDQSDNDPVWFWMYVVAALQKISPGLGIRAIELLAMGADPVQVVLPTLLNDLDTIANPMVLILDDYHLVVSRAVHEQLAFFISRMPVDLHLVMATRSDPMLPLARLRASGELAEMRSDDLRFGAAEADHLLNDVLGLDLAQADIHLVHRRTEGWAAGLYLAALSLAGRADTAAFIKTFAGDNRHIVDYLMAEVLDGQPPHLRSFLLRTSVLGRLSGPLCDAVLQTSGSAAVLEQIERENLFVVPLDMSRHWYRYHHLFGELLRTELRRSEPDLVADLHRRAASWFEAEGLIDEALRHLIAAGDIARSADLIAADWVGEFNGGGLSTISGLLDQLPEKTVLQDPRLSVARAWVSLSVGQLDDAADWIDAVENGSPGDRDGISAQVIVLRAVHSFKTAQIATALETARRAITLDLPEAPLGRPTAYCSLGSALYFSGSPNEAQAAFRRAVELAEKVGDRRARIYALGYLALISAEHGQLADAEREIRRASGSSRDLADAEHLVDVMVSLATANTLRMRGDAAAAAAAADIAVMSARQGGAIPEVAKTLLIKAEISEDLGDDENAKAGLEEVATLVRGCADAGIVPMLLAAAQRSAGVLAGCRNEGCALGEALTPKEFEVLRLLATRLSRREIGERLYVSLNTVKTHQRAIYRKLGVEHRGAAVSRARELGLL
jgi:LuxR family transcriptional regulator, maltose regulon positive regulatory protein